MCICGDELGGGGGGISRSPGSMGFSGWQGCGSGYAWIRIQEGKNAICFVAICLVCLVYQSDADFELPFTNSINSIFLLNVLFLLLFWRLGEGVSHESLSFTYMLNYAVPTVQLFHDHLPRVLMVGTLLYVQLKRSFDGWVLSLAVLPRTITMVF